MNKFEMEFEEYCDESELALPLRAKAGSVVSIYDFTNQEEIVYELVRQYKGIRYAGVAFDCYGNRIALTEEVLESGGNGVTCISIESPLGKQLVGKCVGEIVEYKNLNKDLERFRIDDIQERP